MYSIRSTSVFLLRLLETIEIFELLLPLSLLPGRLVHHPPLLGVEALELPDSSEAPDKPDRPDDGPDDTEGVEPLLDGGALSPGTLTLVLEESSVAGVLSLGPGLVQTQLQGTGA